jgi:hypothetical protein
VGLEVLTVMIMKSYVFWHIMPRSLLKVDRKLLSLFFNLEDGDDMFL